MKDRALITAIVIAGNRYELAIEIRENDRVSLRMADGWPCFRIERLTDETESEVTIPIRTAKP